VIVYSMIEGESPPEAVALSSEDATVSELLDKVSSLRSAKHRQVELLVEGPKSVERLSELGIGPLGLVRVRALGDAKPDVVEVEADAAESEGEPSGEESSAGRRSQRRRLSEYEELSQLLQWHAPFHVNGAAKASYSVWDDASTALRCTDWDAYRAPDSLYYFTYTKLQAKAQNVTNTALDFATEEGMIAGVDPAQVARLRELLPALQYPEWGLCVLHQHTTRFALSSWIAGATVFMMFDELRHAQLYGQLTLAYEDVHGGFDQGERLWKEAQRFQPLRQLIEEVMALLDWGQGIVVADIIVEPIVTAAIHAALKSQSLASGDWLTPFVCQSVENDKLRHRADAAEYLKLVCQDSEFGGANRALVSEWLEHWTPRAIEAAGAVAGGSDVATSSVAAALGWISEQCSAAGVESSPALQQLASRIEKP